MGLPRGKSNSWAPILKWNRGYRCQDVLSGTDTDVQVWDVPVPSRLGEFKGEVHTPYANVQAGSAAWI